MGLSIPGSGLVKKAVGAGAQAAGTVARAGQQVAQNTVDTGRSLVNQGAEVARDTVELRADLEKNFAAGVVEWGKDGFNTIKNVVTHPVETGKGVLDLATNPVLNPVGGLGLAALQGKNPVEAYREGGQKLKAIGSGLVSDYKEVYREHGAAGLAGYLAPDAIGAVLSGGSSSAARGAGTAVAKNVAQEVAEEAVTRGAGEAVERGTTRHIARELGKEALPGPTDIADSARQNPRPQEPGLLDFWPGGLVW